MISYNEALNIIQKEVDALQFKTEQVDLIDAVDRILAEDIYSDINLPPFDNSAMDGIAIKMNPEIKKWKILGDIPAGNYEKFKIDENSAVNIMTGSMLPNDCDTVIPVEDLEIRDHQAFLKEGVRFSRGINIRKRGQDLLKDKVAVKKNTILRPHHIAVAASCGKSAVTVYKRLRIGVMATGDELVDIDEKPEKDKIRCSNLYSLITTIREMNQHPVNLGIIKDDYDTLYDRMKWALVSDLDIVITTGGVSVGKYDFVKDIHQKLGVDIKFWRINVKPGKPVLFGTYQKDGKTVLVFGLPGNPVSSLVSFYLYIQQILLSIFDSNYPHKFTAVLEEELKKENGKRHFMRGLYTYKEDGLFYVRKVGSQSSGNLAEMGQANCLIVVEEEKMNPKKGEKVECIMI